MRKYEVYCPLCERTWNVSYEKAKAVETGQVFCPDCDSESNTEGLVRLKRRWHPVADATNARLVSQVERLWHKEQDKPASRSKAVGVKADW